MASTQAAAGEQAPTKNPHLLAWVDEMARLTQPDRVVWCDGSEEEKQRLTERGGEGRASSSRSTRRSCPGCYLHRTNPNDVARVEHLTFICTPDQGRGRPHQQLDGARRGATRSSRQLFDGCMKGRTMYVVPYVMGPLGSPLREGRRRAHRQLYVVAQHADHDPHGQGGAGAARRPRRLQPRPALHAATSTPTAATSATSPRTTPSGSFGSGYGGNALLGKKCLALRIGSYLGPRGGLAGRAHADPRRRRAPRARRPTSPPPSPRLRQDQLRDADPAQASTRAGRSRPSATTSPGCASGADGRLCAINPEAGYFGVVPGTNSKTNPNAMDDHRHGHHLHQRGAHARRRRVVGGQGRRGRPRSSSTGRASPGRRAATEKAAHPNSRFTAPMTNNPVLAPSANDPQGVPISAIIFGGRRSQHRPAGAPGLQLGPRRVPRRHHGLARPPPPPPARSAWCAATRWPCCRSAATTWATTSRTGCACSKRIDRPARRSSRSTGSARTTNGKFLWPGFGENMRVLKWIIDRVHGRVPTPGDAAGLGAARRATSTSRAWTSPRRRWPRPPPSRPTSGRPSSRARRSSSSSWAPRPPRR